MRSVFLSLLVTVSFSLQQDDSSLCSSLSVIHYNIFPLSTRIKNSLCKADIHTCVAFEMFSANDFAKQVVQLKEQIGCYPKKPSDGIEQSELCNGLRALPESAHRGLFELFSNDPKKMSAFKPMLHAMTQSTEEWLVPILEQYC